MKILSSARICRIKAQGYDKGFNNEEISQHAVGNRFAYQMCTILFLTGLLLTNIFILTAASLIAFLTVVLPYHPFDYLYNYGIRHLLKRPKLPKRTAQAKFACGTAAIWLGVIIFLFSNNQMILGYVLGGVLFFVALLVSTIDYCIPSMIYNTLFKSRNVDQN